MAISLKDIGKNSFDKPPRVVIHGTPGIGKTTFAAGAPSPIFIQVEDGLGDLQVDAFPLAKSFQDVVDAIGTLYNEEHKYRTVVIDTLSALEPLIWQKVSQDHGKANIEDFGYGKGYVLALDTWQTLINGINALRDKGIMPVLLAHTDVFRFDSPETEPYDRYLIKLHKKAFQLLHERCDVIGFANYQTATVKTDAGFNKKVTRGVETGERRLHLVEKPAFVAKNRYGLPESIPLSWPELAKVLTAKPAAKKPTPVKAAK